LRIIGHLFPVFVAVYLLVGNYQLFIPHRVSHLSEAQYQLLDRMYNKQPAATVAAFGDGLIACLPSTIDSVTVKFYREIFVDSLSQSLEFRSQPGLPAIGTFERQELDTKFTLNFNESMKKKLSQKIAAMTLSQQDKIAQFGNSISGQFGEVTSCSANKAIQELENTKP
jgi:hypothetical protein